MKRDTDKTNETSQFGPRLSQQNIFDMNTNDLIDPEFTMKRMETEEKRFQENDRPPRINTAKEEPPI